MGVDCSGFLNRIIGNYATLHVNIIMLFVFLGEWIAGAVCMYTAFRLVSEYGVKEDVTTLLNTLEIVLVPMVNPDGYAVSWEVWDIYDLTSYVCLLSMFVILFRSCSTRGRMTDCGVRTE